jgi:tRNA modification GTPase
MNQPGSDSMTAGDSTTIVAVATAAGKAGLAVVRLSGPEAVAIARRLLPGGALDDPVVSHRARLATVAWPDHAEGAAPSTSPPPGTVIDQVLLLPLLTPASYTGEDTVEFSCHGGALPARQVVAACRAAGALAAPPGEFTRRAFLNGRLSLDQAEAVADLIDAEHAAGARAALEQLRGALRREVGAIEEPLRSLLARLEGAMEFGDGEVVGPGADEIRRVLGDARRAVVDLVALAPAGRRLRDGVQVVLAGPPNAGKSSLFNALLANERALVDAEPGTTRDVITDSLDLDGLRFVLHDTAGLHQDAAGIEARGIERTRDAVAAADIVLELRPVTGALASVHEPVQAPDGSATIVVVTKGDLDPGATGLVTSSITGRGLDQLRAALLDAARELGLAEAEARGVILNERHADRLVACRDQLDQVIAAVDAGDEVVASLLAAALQDLGTISGRIFTEQLLGDIFGRFCVGK